LGQGAPAEDGEATWEEAKFNQVPWTTQGGDFIGTDSASKMVAGLGPYTWTSAGLASDVQMWLDQPGTNFGWMLRGDESQTSAKVFGAKHTATPPRLVVNYLVGPVPTRRETWEAQYYLPGQFINPDGDPDFDRIPALLEYAWDLNPQTKQNLADLLGIDVGATSASVVFRRDPRATDLEYLLQTSTDLVSWSPVVTSTAGAVPTGSALVSEEEDPANTQTMRVTASIPINTATQEEIFIRLSVRRP
jgi:hypothetical protein